MRINKKPLKMRRHLFHFTLILSVSICAILFFGILFWRGYYFRKERFEQFASRADAAFGQVDNQLAALSNLSLSIAYNCSASEQFNTFFQMNGEHSLSDKYESYVYFKSLTETLFSMIGPTLSVPQVYIYNTDRSSFGAGIDNTYRPSIAVDDPDCPKLEDVTGYVSFSPPHADSRISSSSLYERNGLYISALRSVKKLNGIVGYTEVVQRYQTIFAGFRGYAEPGQEVYVFDRQGQLVYPVRSEASEGSVTFEACMQAQSSPNSWMTLDGGRYLHARASTPEGFLYAFVVDGAHLYAGYNAMLMTMIGLFLLAILVFALACYYFSIKMTQPIRKLSDAIESIDMSASERLSFPMVETGIEEIQQMNRIICLLGDRINHYMDRLLISQEQEIQTRILALQAQTNPHFINNTLFNISAMAACHMDGEIETLCSELSSLMHYCSDADSAMVTLGTDLYYTAEYIRCMRIRFPRLQYEVNVDDSLRDLRIPKLIFQLLVENAIKSCTTQRPPWTIRIDAAADAQYYILRVTDDGPGFTGEAFLSIREHMDRVRDLRILPKLKLNGMGILNVYLRLLLVYGEDAQLLISNLEPHGAEIRLMIPIEAERKYRKQNRPTMPGGE